MNQALEQTKRDAKRSVKKQTVGDNNKVTSQAFEITLTLYMFEMILSFCFNCYQQLNQVLGNERKLNPGNFLTTLWALRTGMLRKFTMVYC